MAQEGDIVFMIGADVAGLTKAGQSGERSLAEMEKAAKTLERQLGKIGEAGVSFQREMNALTGVTRDVGKSAKDSAAAFEAFDRSRQQVDNLRASIDPLFAASKRYEQALGQLDTALEQGAISASQHAAMTDMLAASYLRADGAAGMMGAGVQRMGLMSSGARQQLQQVGFQIQDFAVQVGAGTSATQAFAQQFPQMAGAFGPWGVAIGTAAAILVPLGAAFFAASQEADKLTEAMERQKVVSDALVSAAEKLRLEREMAASGAEFVEEQQALNEIVQLTRERKALQVELDALQYDDVEGTNLVVAAKRGELATQRQIIDARLAALRAQLQELENQRAVSKASEIAKRIAEAYKDLQQQIAVANISGPWAAVLGPIQSAIDKAREYHAAMALAGPGKLGREGDDGRGGQRETVAGSRTNMPDQPWLDTGGGGGGGGGGGENPLVKQLEALRQQMMTEEQIELESHAKRQEMLKQALDQKLLTQQEYAALMEQSQKDHSDKMAQIDVWRYGTVLDKASTFFGEMASAMQGGNEKMLKISKAFGAAQALISAWQGAAEALKLPFPQNLAAFAKVLATGLSAVKSIQGAKPGGTTSGGGGGSGGAAAAQQPVTTMNFTLTNDRFGFGENIVRQIASQLNGAGRNGSLIRATVSSA